MQGQTTGTGGQPLPPTTSCSAAVAVNSAAAAQVTKPTAAATGRASTSVSCVSRPAQQPWELPRRPRPRFRQRALQRRPTTLPMSKACNARRTTRPSSEERLAELSVAPSWPRSGLLPSCACAGQGGAARGSRISCSRGCTTSPFRPWMHTRTRFSIPTLLFRRRSFQRGRFTRCTQVRYAQRRLVVCAAPSSTANRNLHRGTCTGAGVRSNPDLTVGFRPFHRHACGR